ncbi:MAG: fructose-bisphosphatase class II, partial [Alphaproteobacteria bacterium]|nr:fructose-bisphosphatase class II [Alphaproteobacteria bacterium]
LNRKYGLKDLASGDVLIAATGVTDGSMLRGVRRRGGEIFTHSIVMHAETRSVRWIEARRAVGDVEA